ncbi:MAG: hypothetical protein LC634_07230, partial [Sphingomonadales bacterium]|nr:hypothetical protein [Sphingomonadales bacterium]
IEGSNQTWVRNTDKRLRNMASILADSKWSQLPRRFLVTSGDLIWPMILISGFITERILGIDYIINAFFGESERTIAVRNILNTDSVTGKIDLLAILWNSAPDTGAHILGVSAVFILVLFVGGFCLTMLFGAILPRSLISLGDFGAIAKRDRDGWQRVINVAIMPFLVSVLAGFAILLINGL